MSKRDELRTGMRALLIYALLASFAFLSMTQAIGKRINNFRACKPSTLVFQTRLRVPGCPPRPLGRFRVYGCRGYCRSETLSLTDRKELVHNCKCCQAVSKRIFKWVVPCGNKYQVVTIPSATQCACRKCSPLT